MLGELSGYEPPKSMLGLGMKTSKCLGKQTYFEWAPKYHPGEPLLCRMGEEIQRSNEMGFSPVTVGCTWTGSQSLQEVLLCSYWRMSTWIYKKKKSPGFLWP